MKATGKIWVFYNSQTAKQTKPMSTVQAQMALLSLKTRDLKTIHLWTPGWESWQNIEVFLQSNQTIFVIGQPPKPAPLPNIEASTEPDAIDEITRTVSDYSIQSEGYTRVESAIIAERPASEAYGYFHQDFNGEDLDISKINKVEKVRMKTPKHSNVNDNAAKRATVRHDFKIEVVIISKEKSFRTYSENISLGGTLLEDEIPNEFLNRPFDLIIINRFESDTNRRQLLFKAKIVGDITNPRRLMFTETDPKMVSNLDALLKAYTTYQEQMKKQAS